MNSTPKRRSRFNLLKLFFIATWMWLLGCFLIYSVHFNTRHQELKTRLALLEKQHTDLVALAERIRDSRPRYRYEKQVINDILRSCRNLRDFPIIHHDRILVSQYRSILDEERSVISGDFDTYLMFVPTGKHALSVYAEWTNIDEQSIRGLRQNQFWEFPLRENSRYMLKIEDSPSLQQVGWRLESDNPAFQPQLGTVAEGRLVETISNEHTPIGIMYPNEVNEAPVQFRSSNRTTAGVPVMRRSYMCVNQIGNVILRLEFRVVSDGPVIIPASEYGRWSGPRRYIGRGRYAADVNEIPYLWSKSNGQGE